ncbi:MAG: right-handed parallel beta-helix repeat-containing protein [Trueperaceae bacterium]
MSSTHAPTNPARPRTPNPSTGHSARSRLRAGIGALVASVTLTASVLLAACAPPPVTVDFYVHPVTGNDANPGTAAAPYKTLTYALTRVGTGQTIHLAAGTYDAASGEVWPQQVGFPPTATPNVPDGVRITADGNLVRLAGPGAASDAAALVVEGAAEVIGVRVTAFQRGVLAGPGSAALLDGVEISGNGAEGLLVYGNANVVLRDSAVHENGASGVGAYENATLTLDNAQVNQNQPGVTAADAASVTIEDSEIYANGTVGPGPEHAGIYARGDAGVTITNTAVHDNAHAGVFIQGDASVTVGAGSDLYLNFIGVMVDLFQAGAIDLAFDGATVRDSDSEGILWTAPMGARFHMRDTQVTDNFSHAVLFVGDAAVIDMGTSVEAGGNTFAGNVYPQIYDGRPGRAAADGTIITVSRDGLIPPGCLTMAGPYVGPATITCGANDIVDILHANNRLELTSVTTARTNGGTSTDR